MVIFSYRYLDSDLINFKTFVFLAVYWSIWTSWYNADIKVQPFLNGASTILNNVFKVVTFVHSPSIHSLSQDYVTRKNNLATLSHVYHTKESPDKLSEVYHRQNIPTDPTDLTIIRNNSNIPLFRSTYMVNRKQPPRNHYFSLSPCLLSVTK